MSRIWNVLAIKCPGYEISWLWMSCLCNVLSMRCHIYAMSCLCNALFMQCPIYEMSYLWNVLAVKCPNCERSQLLNFISLKYLSYEMSCPWTVLFMKCPICEIFYLNILPMKCPVYKTSSKCNFFIFTDLFGPFRASSENFWFFEKISHFSNFVCSKKMRTFFTFFAKFCFDQIGENTKFSRKKKCENFGEKKCKHFAKKNTE